MSNLYELAKEWREAEAEIDEIEATDTSTTESKLWELMKTIEMEAAVKVASIVKWMQNDAANAETLEREIAVLTAKKCSLRKREESKRKFLAEFMKSVGMTKFDAGIRKLSFQKGRVSLVVDESKVHDWAPDFYDAAINAGAIVERVEVKKTELKKLDGYLKQPGVLEVVGEDSLVIR